MVSFSVQDAELQELIKEGQVTFFDSRYNFLREINGLRPSCLTGILSNTSTGKSTLVKSILIDSIQIGRALVWLTEESVAQYQIKLAYIGKNYNKDNIAFIDEQSDDEIKTKKNPKDLCVYIYNLIMKTKSKSFFIDNLTTSDIYEGFSPNDKTIFVDLLKRMAKTLKIPIVFVAHTDSKISNSTQRFTEGEDIRGSRQPFLQAAYFFIVQRFYCNGRIFTFLRIVKHRFHEIKNMYFLLEWSDFQFKRDVVIGFDRINEAFSNRDYLGKSEKRNKKGA